MKAVRHEKFFNGADNAAYEEEPSRNSEEVKRNVSENYHRSEGEERKGSGLC